MALTWYRGVRSGEMIVSVSRPELRGAKGAARKRGRLGNLLDGTLGLQGKASPNPLNFCTEVTSAREVENQRPNRSGSVQTSAERVTRAAWRTLSGSELIKIMGRGWGTGDDERQNLVCLNRDDMILILQNTFHQKKWC